MKKILNTIKLPFLAFLTLFFVSCSSHRPFTSMTVNSLRLDKHTVLSGEFTQPTDNNANRYIWDMKTFKTVIYANTKNSEIKRVDLEVKLTEPQTLVWSAENLVSISDSAVNSTDFVKWLRDNIGKCEPSNKVWGTVLVSIRKIYPNGDAIISFLNPRGK